MITLVTADWGGQTEVGTGKSNTFFAGSSENRFFFAFGIASPTM